MVSLSKCLWCFFAILCSLLLLSFYKNSIQNSQSNISLEFFPTKYQYTNITADTYEILHCSHFNFVQIADANVRSFVPFRSVPFSRRSCAILIYCTAEMRARLLAYKHTNHTHTVTQTHAHTCSLSSFECIKSKKTTPTYSALPFIYHSLYIRVCVHVCKSVWVCERMSERICSCGLYFFFTRSRVFCVCGVFTSLVGVSKRLTPILFSKPIITATCCSYSTSPYIDSAGIHTLLWHQMKRYSARVRTNKRTNGLLYDWLFNVCFALWFDLIWFGFSISNIFPSKTFQFKTELGFSWLAEKEDNTVSYNRVAAMPTKYSCTYFFMRGKEIILILL